MSIIKFNPEALLQEMPEAKPAPVPLGDVISKISVRSFPSETVPSSRSGVWECSPGRWRRQVVAAEFCVFVAGRCVFSPDEGEPIEITAGEAVYFPANTGGVWDVHETARKIYIVFDEAR